jgi:hypothetical protein
MSKCEILIELVRIADRLQELQHDCNAIKGYAGGAAEVAALAVHHVIDLVRVAIDEGDEAADEIEKLRSAIMFCSGSCHGVLEENEVS